MSRVALIGQNSVEYINALVNIWNNGDCAVLIDWQVPIETAVNMMREAKVTTCFLEQKIFDNVYQSIVNGSIRFIPYTVSEPTVNLLPYEVTEKYIENYSHDEAIVIYSSGTTGKSKGIILSHFAISTNADAIIDYMGVGEEDCLYIAKPLSHSSTIVGELLVSLKSGTRLVVAPTAVPPRFVLNKLFQYDVTMICLNPTLLRMYIEECQRKSYAFPSLKKIYVSGSILDDRLYRTAHEFFRDIELFNMYGLSEAGPRVTAQRADGSKSNSVGKPIKGVEIAIVDENGAMVSEGARGIVHVHTPSLFSGYILGEQKHRSLYRGWLNTGDIGYIDENGELHIAGRADDLIIIDAHKIYPNDVEKAIFENTEVTECVVAGYIHASTGIVSLGCVYVSETDLTVVDNKKLGKILMPYEMPKCYLRVRELPKNRNGKILRNEASKLLK